MKQLIRAESFRELFVEKTPLLDVRAPIEFAKGAFPGAVNLPILSDSERESVGKAYRQHGQKTAIALGHKLVGEEIRDQRLQGWIDFLGQHPDAAIYCFRGGLRSTTAQQWLTAAGYSIPRVAGGQKAMRQFLLDVIDSTTRDCEFLLIAGKTGCGKTLLLNQFSNRLDLEGFANHRGSAFGNRVQPQPTQIDFENLLAIELLNLPYTDYQRLLLEDEGRAIGSVSIPLNFYTVMKNSPIAAIEQDLNYRASIILNDYIAGNYQEFEKQNPQQAPEHFNDYLFSSLARIRKRLGGVMYDEIFKDMETAVLIHQRENSIELHKIWIEKLLRNYYDPMYEYQLGKKLNKIVFRGSAEEFADWAGHIRYMKNPELKSNAN